MKQIIKYFLPTILFSISLQAFAVDIVRLKLEYSGSQQTIDIELHSDVALLTVENYLNYVNSGSYDNTFVHRKITDFIFQAGGYIFDPANRLADPLSPISDNAGLEKVFADAPVVNEFNLSNIRGTLALAKLGGDPDSGTSEWFINLDDNSGNLDNQNGGFTVFGTVIDNGMVIADEINSFPKHPTASQIESAFADLPMVNYDLSSQPPVLRENMVMINTITTIARPVLRLTPHEGAFGLDVAGDANAKFLTVTLKNKGNQELKIDSIDTTNLLAPFSLNNDACTPNNLQPVSTSPLSSCNLIIAFSTVTADVFSGSLTIHYSSTDADTFTVTYAVTGVGVTSTPVLNTSQTSIDFGETILPATPNKTITLTNVGGGSVDITAINLTGLDTNQYVISNTGCSDSTLLQIEQSCELGLVFNPDSNGNKTANLNVEWNTTNSQLISLEGVGIKHEITSPTSFDLGAAQVNQMVQDFFSISNSGTGNLTINSIDISGADSLLFTQENLCPDTNNTEFATQPLDASSSCNIRISYMPTSEGNHTALLSILSTDPDNPLVTVNLSGKTGLATIQGPLTFDVGTSEVNGTSSSKTVTITNIGEAPLEISEITGLDLTDFTQVNNCIGSNSQLEMNETCSISVTYNALTHGDASTTMTIASNDTVNGNFNIALSAFGDNDIDGIHSDIELSGPNSGDGNNDDIFDDVQSNVATFKLINGIDITLISDKSIPFQTDTSLVNVVAFALDAGIQPPDGITIENGIISYSVNVPLGSAVNVGLLLPAGKMPNSYYIYGPTADNTTPHWYDFTHNPDTRQGANLIGSVTLTSPSGDLYSANMIILGFVDGGTGDDDMAVNGVIEHKMGALVGSLNNNDNSGSGSLSYLYLLFILLLKRTFGYKLNRNI